MAASESCVARIVVVGTYTGADEADGAEAPVWLVQELARRWEGATCVRVVRFPHVFGELDAWDRRTDRSIAGLCRRFARAALAGDAVVEAPIDRRCRRRYLYVDDCISALLDAMWAHSGATVIDVPGELVFEGDVVDELGRIAGVGVSSGVKSFAVTRNRSSA